MNADQRNAFDEAREANERVNDLLADTDGAIAAMELAGAIGYHVNVATGETDPEYLWKIALLEALDETVLEMAYVDAPTPSEAREQLSRDLRRSFDPATADHVLDVFEDKLASLVESQEEIAAEQDGGDGA